MRPDERFDDQQHAIEETIKRYLDRVWTSMPGIVVPGSWDGTKQTVKLYVTPMGSQRTFAADGTPTYTPVKMPVVPDVPVHFPAWGGYTITGPVSDNDEGMILFAARCIDGWWQNGGQAKRLSERRHSLSDAMFIPGLKSQPNKLNPTVSTSGVQIRSNDGTAYIQFSKTGAVVVFPNAAHTMTPTSHSVAFSGKTVFQAQAGGV
jgi:protein gp138